MAFRDTTKKPFIEDRDTNVFIGIDYPFHRSDGSQGWFASTDTTIKAVKNNVRMLLSTYPGERLFQPTIGIGLQKFLFEQFTPDTRIAIENEIVDAFNLWLPFVEIKELEVEMIGNDPVGKNKLSIYVAFNIIRDPNTLESVQVEIGD